MNIQATETYSSFLASATQKQWKKIGLVRRAGVATPLFSIYSSKSIGIGEIPDLRLLVDWCVATGMSMIQLLPMNDVGFSFRPYDAQSTFALEPMYLSLTHLVGVETGLFRNELEALARRFPPGGEKADYKIKGAKLDLLWKIFQGAKERVRGVPSFRGFVQNQKFWLEDYSLFKVIKDNHGQINWEQWPEKFKSRDPATLEECRAKNKEKLEFQKWLQWQLFEQFKAVKEYARAGKVFLMGDLPFLVSRDSADVWSRQDYFKLDLASGAPPDAYFALGQRWGMPPYRWDRIAQNEFDYLIQKLKYAQNFYDVFRIDHVVGVFRLWTISQSEPAENHGLNGVFDPSDENQWEEHGRKLLSLVAENAEMLPSAEDLGIVPACSYRVLEEFAIPGMDVQRWTKEWETTCDFKAPEKYRKNSTAVISNHDMSSFQAWWEFEAGTVDAELFERIARSKGIEARKVGEALFDRGKSHYGRLRWREAIKDIPALLAVLGRPEGEVRDIVDLYRGSYDEKRKFWDYLALDGPYSEKMTPALIRRALEKINASASIFSIQLLQDWLALGGIAKQDTWNFRINFPGTMNDRNWTLVLPLSLEGMNRLEINREIKKINTEAGRV